MNQIRQGFRKSEGEEKDLTSLFKEDAAPICTGFKYFGTLGSFPSLAFLSRQFSKPVVDATAPNSVATFSDCSNRKGSAVVVEPRSKLSGSASSVGDGHSSANELLSAPSIGPHQSSSLSVSLVQNVRASIYDLKAKSTLSEEEREFLKSVDSELVENLKELQKLQSRIGKFPAEPKNVRRIIGCDPASRVSVHEVTMCDNHELPSVSSGLDAESNKSVDCARQTNKDNNGRSEHSLQIQIDFDREPHATKIQTSDSSFSQCSSQAPSDRQHRCRTSEAEEANSNSSVDFEGNSPIELGPPFPENSGQSTPNSSSYYQPTEHSFVCCCTRIQSSFTSTCKHPASGSDWMDCVSRMNSSDSTDSCPHPRSSAASTIVPQQSPLILMKSFSRSKGLEDKTFPENNRRTSAGSCDKHENSRTLLKSISMDYKNTKNVMLLKRIGEENEKLKEELRKRDVELLHLNKRVKCLQFEAEIKSRDNCKPSSQPSCQKREPNLQALSNSISNIHRNIEVYCSCLTGNPCELEKQLNELERELCQVKKEYEAKKSERLGKRSALKPVEDANQTIEANPKDCGGKESALVQKLSRQFISCQPSSSQTTDEHSHLKFSSDTSIGNCKTDCSATRDAEKLQDELVKVNKQNEILLESVKDNLVSESALNAEISELQSVIMTLKEDLKQCTCDNSTKKGWMKCLNCTSCCAGSRSGGSEYQMSPTEESDTEELNKQLCFRADQIRALSEQLEQLTKKHTELVTDLETRIKLIEELRGELKKREGMVACLESELTSNKDKIVKLQNQLTQQETSEQNHAEAKESNVDTQNYENRINELETKLKDVKGIAETRECLIADLSKKLKLAEEQVTRLQGEAKNYEDSAKNLQKKLSLADKKNADTESKLCEVEKELVSCRARNCFLEERLQSGRVKITALEEQLSRNERTMLELSGALINSQTKSKDLEEQLNQSEEKISELKRQMKSASTANGALENSCSSHLRNQNICSNQSGNQNVCPEQLESLQKQLSCLEERLCSLISERDQLLKGKEEALVEIEDLKLNTKRLEITNFSLAREIAAEVERIKESITDKLSNFSPLICALEKTRAELQETQSLFEDAENRCCSLNQKLNQTNEELRTLKAIKQSQTGVGSTTKTIQGSQNSCSLENQHQVLLSEACESLNMLNNEKLQLKSAVETLINENKQKDEQLSKALVEVEALKKEVCVLKSLAEEKKGC